MLKTIGSRKLNVWLPATHFVMCTIPPPSVCFPVYSIFTNTQEGHHLPMTHADDSQGAGKYAAADAAALSLFMLGVTRSVLLQIPGFSQLIVDSSSSSSDDEVDESGSDDTDASGGNGGSDDGDSTRS